MQRITVKRRYTKDGRFGDYGFRDGVKSGPDDINVIGSLNEWLDETLSAGYALNNDEGMEQYLKNMDIDVAEQDVSDPIRSKEERFKGIVDSFEVSNTPDSGRYLVPKSSLDMPAYAQKHSESLQHASTILGYDVFQEGFVKKDTFRGEVNQALVKTLELEEREGIEGGLKSRLEEMGKSIDEGKFDPKDRDRTHLMSSVIVGVDESTPYPEWESAVFDKMSPIRERDYNELLTVAGAHLKEHHLYTDQELEDLSRDVELGNIEYENQHQKSMLAKEARRKEAESKKTQEVNQSTTQPLHGSNVDQNNSSKTEFLKGLDNAKSNPEIKGDNVEASSPSDESYTLNDLTAKQKETNKLLGIEGKSIEKDLSALRSTQERLMILDHLQKTAEGKHELESYIAARAGRIKENNVGLKGAKLHNKTLSVMMQMPTEELLEAFPETSKRLNEERQGLDVNQEFEEYKKNNPEVADSPEATQKAISELQFQKQVDNRLGPVGGMSLMDRLKKGAKHGLAAAAVGAAVASAPAGIAAFVAVKVAKHYANKLIDSATAMDKPVSNALINNGLATQDDIDKSKAQSVEKTRSKNWKNVLGKAAVGAGIFVAGMMAGDLDLSSAKESIVELARDASELISNADISGISELNALSGVEMADSVANVTGPEVPDASIESPGDDVVTQVSDTAIEGANAVAESASAEAVTHTVSQGDTMSHIAVNYLSEKGIDFSASDLYGPDGILSQTGMNIDLIQPGQEIDLTELERYAQSLESGDEFVPNADAIEMNSPSSAGSVESGSPAPPQDPATSRFLGEVEASRGAEHSGLQSGMYASVDAAATTPSAVSGSAVEGGFTSEVPNERTYTEAEALAQLPQDLIARGVEMTGPDGGEMEFEIGPVMTAGEMLNNSSIERVMEDAVGSSPPAVSPSGEYAETGLSEGRSEVASREEAEQRQRIEDSELGGP